MGRRMKLEIAYHGPSFHGWQKQRDQRTVQGELHAALAVLFRKHRVLVVGASRTDTGVHAAGQVAHLDPPGSIPPEALVRGLNSRLPRQIRVLSAHHVADTFPGSNSARPFSGRSPIQRVLRMPSIFSWDGTTGHRSRSPGQELKQLPAPSFECDSIIDAKASISIFSARAFCGIRFVAWSGRFWRSAWETVTWMI